jgi:hypothetical protein
MLSNSSANECHNLRYLRSFLLAARDVSIAGRE